MTIDSAYKKIVDDMKVQGWSVSAGKIAYAIKDDEKTTSKTYSFSLINQSDVLRFANLTNQVSFRCEMVMVYHFKTEQNKFSAYTKMNAVKDMFRNPEFWDTTWKQIKNESIEYLEKQGSYIKGRLLFDLHLNAEAWTTTLVEDMGTFDGTPDEILDFGGFV